MLRKKPCHTCRGGSDCADCLHDLKNSVPVKIYTPKGAARAMMGGKTLKKKDYATCFWGEHEGEIGFWNRYDDGAVFPLRGFGGLYEELA
jgi:hypothetical protein